MSLAFRGPTALGTPKTVSYVRGESSRSRNSGPERQRAAVVPAACPFHTTTGSTFDDRDW